jgi:hypothetical protein
MFDTKIARFAYIILQPRGIPLMIIIWELAQGYIVVKDSLYFSLFIITDFSVIIVNTLLYSRML